MTKRQWTVIFWVYLALAIVGIAGKMPVAASVGVLMAVLAGYKLWYEY